MNTKATTVSDINEEVAQHNNKGAKIVHFKDCGWFSCPYWSLLAQITQQVKTKT